MSDLIIQFARLWGLQEAYRDSTKEEEISDMLKGYDSIELSNLLYNWVEEYDSTNANDTVDFFEQKIEEMYEKEYTKCQCPNGGDETNDCADCAYSCDYHFVNGECARREDDDYTPSAENGDYSPSNPWDAPGMKMSDFI